MEFTLPPCRNIADVLFKQAQLRIFRTRVASTSAGMTMDRIDRHRLSGEGRQAMPCEHLLEVEIRWFLVAA